MVGLLDSIESITTIEYDTKVDVTSGANTGITAVVSMTKAEKQRLISKAKEYGLSLPEFFRFTADEYMRNHNW